MELPEQFNIVRRYLALYGDSYKARNKQQREAAREAFAFIEAEYVKALKAAQPGALLRPGADGNWEEVPTTLSEQIEMMNHIIGAEMECRHGKR